MGWEERKEFRFKIKKEKFNLDPHCHYCGRETWVAVEHATTIRESRRVAMATLDHVITKTAGGRDTRENTVLACYQCNSIRGRTEYHEFVVDIKNYKGNLGALKKKYKDRMSYRMKLRRMSLFAYI